MRGVARLAFLIGALALSPKLARADEPRREFTWDAPEGCPSSQEMLGRIRARVQSGSSFTIRGLVFREGSRFRVQLTTPMGERVLSAPTCEQAAEAVVVIVALAVDGALADRPPPEPPRTEPIRVEPSSRDAVSTAAGERTWSLFLGGAIDSSSLPRPSPGVAVSVGVELGAVRLGVDLGGFLAQTEQSSGEPPVSAKVALVDAMAVGCLMGRLPAGGPVEVGGCIGGGVGILPAESAGITSPNTGAGVRPEVLAAARAGWKLGERFYLRIQGGPLVDPARPPFRVEGVGDVYRPPAVSFRGSLGVETRF